MIPRVNRACWSVFFCVAATIFGSGCGRTSLPVRDQSAMPERVVSTAPSITETLFAIGVGDRVVGVTRFCLYPPEARSRRTVGDLLHPHWETILTLEPDILFALRENEKLVETAREFGIRTETVDHRSLDGILASLSTLAAPFGDEVAARAAVLRASLEARLAAVRSRAMARRPVRTLICVDRLRGMGRIQGVFVAGSSPLFADVLRLAGGENVVESSVVFPTLSLEAVLRLEPDVILDLVTGEIGVQPHLDDWKGDAAVLSAVQTGRVFALTEDYATIPGPRIVDLIERVADLLDAAALPVSPPSR